MGLPRKCQDCDYNLFLMCCTWVCCVLAVKSSTIVVVNSPFGKIQGLEKMDDVTGLTYVSFRGIPYAKPPVGPLRFEKPQPHPNIEGTFDATKDDQIICPHSDQMTVGQTGFTEDCLVLNVYTKGIDNSSPRKKVLVYIHGGGFRALSGGFQDPKSFVITQGIIVVTINYRLGVLGFLSTENDAAPGNFGLWDQTLAIKWVKDNIRAFGGDPDDIAIAGQSAGGVSVEYQAISPRAKGLFSKAYAHSGTATSSFALTSHALIDALSVAKGVGCWTKSVNDNIDLEESNAVVTCLRKAPLSSITAFHQYSLTDIQFAPRIDGDFIPDTPSKLLQNEAYLDSVGFFDRTYLTGINNNEAKVSYGYVQLFDTVVSLDQGMTQEQKQEAVKSYKTQTVQAHIRSMLGESAVSDKNVSTAITNFYKRRFVNERSFIETMTDISFLIPSLDFVRAASRRENCNSYLFYFDYYPQFMKGAYTGTPHSADLLFWFDIEVGTLEKVLQAGMEGDITEGEDMDMRRLFSSLIGEFVRSGNPGAALVDFLPCGWPRYDVIKGQFLNVNTKPWIGSVLEKDKQDLWFKTLPRLMGSTDDPEVVKGQGSECGANGVPVGLQSHRNSVVLFVIVCVHLIYFTVV